MENKKYNEVEVKELILYIVNDGDLYRKHTRNMIQTLRKKMSKGDYSQSKALILFKRLADIGAKKYSKEFANKEEWNTIFSVEDRKEVAIRLEDYFFNFVID